MFGLATNLWAYWYSDTMVLSCTTHAKSMRHRRRSYMPPSRILPAAPDCRCRGSTLIDEAQPNAFATGRNPEHAALAATTGILQLLTARELRGVLGHELAHVRNRDILTSTITASIAGAISTLAHFGMFFGRNDDDHRNPLLAILVLILAPIAALLIQLAISRGREYEADRTGSEISGDPRALADALAKIDRYAKGLPLETSRSASGDCANDDHQSAARRRHRRTFQHASADRGAYPPPARASTLEAVRLTAMEQAQRIAAKAVRRVLAGVALGAALEEAGAAKSGERALATELAYGTLRFLGQVRTAVRMLAERPLTDQSIEALLWVALYQLIHTTAPAHAVVDSAVRATGQLKRTSAKGLTNAILRTFLRRRESASRRDLERCGRTLFVSALVDRSRIRRSMRPALRRFSMQATPGRH